MLWITYLSTLDVDNLLRHRFVRVDVPSLCKVFSVALQAKLINLLVFR
jgi:hypothetical protein